MVARICREAGGRVTTNVPVRNLDLVGPGVEDNRRLEVVADGLPLFGGAQLAIDTTEVSAWRRAATHDGVATTEARRKMPDLPRVAWVVAVEVGGRWSHEILEFSFTVGQSKGQGRNRVDATTCGAVVAFTMGFILVTHCRSGGGFHDVGIAWRSRRRW